MKGFFTFKWSHPAGEVYVTGTFDNWKKSTKLEKEGDSFVAKVELPAEKTLYKFVVDGNWVVDQDARKEFDEAGIENNLLIPDDIITMSETDISNATISSAAPDATTASLAAAVPIEHATGVSDNTVPVATPGPDDVPGGFPETPAATETTDPTPIVTENKEHIFSVKPLPASDTPTNPFHLEPGEPIPQNEFTTADINTHVKLDEESYNNADASNLGFGLGGAPVLPEVVTPAPLREAEGCGVFDIPVVSSNTIPESSLPITSFAAATAAQTVPDIVKESQEKADVEPEASAVPEVVELKQELEQELKTEVPVIPEIKPVEEKEIDTAAVTAATTVGGIMAAAGIASASGEPNDETAPAVVPEIVRESQQVAHVEPEASGVEDVVVAKKEFEEELKKEVHQTAPVTLNSAVQAPVVVQKSLAKSGTAPEATVVPKAVELKEEVKPTEGVTPKAVVDTPSVPPAVPSKTENGVSNGNGTSLKSDKSSDKEIEANGHGTKSPKKSFENGDAADLKRKRRSIFSTIKEKLGFHSPTGTKDKGKAKGEISP